MSGYAQSLYVLQVNYIVIKQYANMMESDENLIVKKNATTNGVP